MSAAELRALHVPGRPLVLPNAWDADSARLVEAAGFPVVATSSAAVAAALGHADGEAAPAGEMLLAAARIVRAVSVPVTVDAESGYGLIPAELVDRLLDLGAAGFNLEDTDHSRSELRPVTDQADRLAALRQAAGQDLVISARIDAFIGAPDPHAVFADAVTRGQAYLAAGADCVYPITLTDPDLLAEFVRETGAVNASLPHGGPGLPALASLGVARISLGAGLWRHMRGLLGGVLDDLAAGKVPY
ncbi:isocitrate lyase/phosphoenolpyruvate mutase family protein [Amycolatopsis sp. NPDC047767]|uniref:isocitrate lyase/PEP mutase family protein n=1 Tax=Amycolatopsis sp. NPDC047767 TaxID=3156765 RepID=UPI0034523FFC